MTFLRVYGLFEGAEVDRTLAGIGRGEAEWYRDVDGPPRPSADSRVTLALTSSPTASTS
jgi:hypothetical protein